MAWEVDTWQIDNGKWVWALWRDGENVTPGRGLVKPQPSEEAAVDAAKTHKQRLQQTNRSRRIVLED